MKGKQLGVRLAFALVLIVICTMISTHAWGQALQTPTRESQQGATGATLTFSNSRADNVIDFEYVFSGAPASNTIVLSGCHIGGTCDQLDSYTTANTNVIKNYNGGKIYDYFTVAITLGGGTNPKLTVNRISIRAGGGGGGTFLGGALTQATSFPDGTLANPSVRFTNDSANIGWKRLTSDGGWGFSAGGTLAVGFTATGAPGLSIYGNGFMQWRNTGAEGSGTLCFQQPDTTNGAVLSRGPCGKVWYATDFVSLSNQSGLEISTAAGFARIRGYKAASGTVPSVAIWTGKSTNTDMAGSITLAAGTGSYTFTDTYATAPICVATDTTAAAAVKLAVTTTTITFTGTTTDVINYICVPRT